jgi:hypothetical protein
MIASGLFTDSAISPPRGRSTACRTGDGAGELATGAGEGRGRIGSVIIH